MTDEIGEDGAPRSEAGTGENDRIGRLFREPMQFLSVAWLITVVVLIGFVWKSYDSYRRFQSTTQRSLEIQELRGQIIYLDEVLTMSARMAAATGDPRWETRYRKNEPKLDEALAKAQSLVPDAQATALTNAANLALVEMENQAFDLSRAGRLTEARDILSSDEYARQKAIYAEGMHALGTQLQQAVASSLRAQERRTVAQLVVGMLAILLLLVGWVVVHNLCKKYAQT